MDPKTGEIKVELTEKPDYFIVKQKIDTKNKEVHETFTPVNVNENPYLASMREVDNQKKVLRAQRLLMRDKLELGHGVNIIEGGQAPSMFKVTKSPLKKSSLSPNPNGFDRSPVTGAA